MNNGTSLMDLQVGWSRFTKGHHISEILESTLSERVSEVMPNVLSLLCSDVTALSFCHLATSH